MNDDEARSILETTNSYEKADLAAEVLRRGEVIAELQAAPLPSDDDHYELIEARQTIATYRGMIAKYRAGCEPHTEIWTWAHLDRERDQPMTDDEIALLDAE